MTGLTTSSVAPRSSRVGEAGVGDSNGAPNFSVAFVEQMHYLSNLVHISGSIIPPSFYKGDDLGTVRLNLKRGLRPMQS